MHCIRACEPFRVLVSMGWLGLMCKWSIVCAGVTALPTMPPAPSIGEADGSLPPVPSTLTHQQRVLAAAAMRPSIGREHTSERSSGTSLGSQRGSMARAVDAKDAIDISDVEPVCEASEPERASGFRGYVASARQLLHGAFAKLCCFWPSAGTEHPSQP